MFRGKSEMEEQLECTRGRECILPGRRENLTLKKKQKGQVYTIRQSGIWLI